MDGDAGVSSSSAADDSAVQRLERRLQYSFADRNLLMLALTHRSQGEPNNERLEFLGDAALGFIVGDALFEAFPDAREHALTVMRASLVKRAALVKVAHEIELGEFLRLGSGERRSGGHQRESILADTLEALLGAVLKDGGYDAVRGVITTLFGADLRAADASRARDSKTMLQERLQARHVALPRYTVTAQHGDAHAPQFEVACRIEALSLVTQGSGSTRRDAEKCAAAAALQALDATDDH